MDAPQLELLFTVTANTTVGGMIAAGPTGTVVVVDASTGTFEGPNMRGTVAGPSGDWVTVLADGTMTLDVRLLLKTDDGADILMQYKGYALEGGQHITTAPMFLTSAEKYAFLNTTVGIARGATGAGAVTYDVYAVK